MLISVALCAQATAATIPVTTQVDGFTANGMCSLREAISAANGTDQPGECALGDPTGTDTISLPAGTYTLTSSTSDDTNVSGDLDITSNVALVGAGSATTTIDAQQQDRVIDVISANVSISGVTITGGRAKDGSSPFGANFGGGIRHNGGSLTLSGVTVTGNAAGNGSAGVFNLHGAATNGGIGGFGGGIYSSGLGLTVTGSTISNNTAGGGGAGGGTSDGTGGQGGQGGRGGGIASDAGDLASTFTITDTTISGNSAGAAAAGATPGSNAGTAGLGGDGGVAGGLYVFLPSNGNAAQLSGLTVTGNHAGAGGAAGTGGAQARAGGTGGGGGGVMVSGHATLTDSTLTQNHAGAGGNGTMDGAGGTGGSGGGFVSGDTVTLARITASGNSTGDGGAPRGLGGTGGGLYLIGLAASLTGSTISGNTTGAGANSSTNAAGAGGSGAGIYAGAPFTLTNSTIANNTTGAGGSYTGAGCPNWAFGSPSGAAGGLFMNQYDATVTHVTVAGNSTGSGGSGICNSVPVSGYPSPRGGIVMSGGGTLTLSNSIIASNNRSGTANCYTDFGGTLADGGGNLAYPQDYNYCPGIYADPQLGALANNGGPTQTMALLTGSGAIDIGAAGKCLSIDQRGTSRPQGVACDAGAYEKEQPPLAQQDTSTNTSTTPTDTPPAGSPPAGPAADRTAPLVKLLLRKQRLLKALRNGYAVAFTSNEGGVAKATLFLKNAKVASGRLSVSVAGRLKLVAKFTRKAKKSLARRRMVRLRLVLVMTDTAGNGTRKTAAVTLRR